MPVDYSKYPDDWNKVSTHIRWKRAGNRVKCTHCGQPIQDKRTLEQNALLHSLLAELAATRKWAGAYQDLETWKRLATAAWMRAEGIPVTVLPALDGNCVDVIHKQTSRMSKAQMSSLVSYIEAFLYGEEAA